MKETLIALSIFTYAFIFANLGAYYFNYGNNLALSLLFAYFGIAGVIGIITYILFTYY